MISHFDFFSVLFHLCHLFCLWTIKDFTLLGSPLHIKVLNVRSGSGVKYGSNWIIKRGLHLDDTESSYQLGIQMFKVIKSILIQGCMSSK